MDKDKILFGIIGLLAGIIIGFSVANTINQNDPSQTASTIGADPLATSSPDLPPDHPPVGATLNQDQNAPNPQITEAIEKANQNPGDYELQMTAGDLYYQIQRFEEATKFYLTANKIKPTETEPIIKLGNSYFDAQKYVEAEKWYESALEKKPNDINVRNDYGLTFFLRSPKDVDRAIKEYKASLAIDPNYELTLQNLVIAYKDKNDTENLQKTLEILRKINPENPAIKQIGEAKTN